MLRFYFNPLPHASQKSSLFSQSRLSRSRGFSLVELIVVVAVIAILAAITLVAISSVRQQAQSAKSLSHLRQSGTALLLQGVSNNGTLTLVGFQGGSAHSWLTGLRRSLGEEIALDVASAAVSPLHRPFSFSLEKEEYANHDPWNHIFGVPMNSDSGAGSSLADPALERVYDGGNTLWSSRQLYLSRLQDTADYILLVDSISTANPNVDSPQWRTAWDNGQFSMAHARHNGKMHAAMADGSAVILSPEAYAGHRARAMNLSSYSLTYFGPEGKAEAQWSR